MSLLFSVFKLLQSKDVKDRIHTKIINIKECCDWSKFDVGVSLEDIDLSKLNYCEVVEERNMWRNIAKLSINLFTDFDFYRQFVLETHCDSEMYIQLLNNLGFVHSDGQWRTIRSPDASVVNTNVFMFCLYQLICDEMGRCKLSVAGNMQTSVCFFCSYKIDDGDEKCGGCNASMEEIKLHYQISSSNNDSAIIDGKDGCIVNETRDLESSGGGWICVQCEFLNTDERDMCSVCEEVRPQYDGWICELCDIRNHLNSDVCDMCGNDKLYNEGLKSVNFKTLSILRGYGSVVHDEKTKDTFVPSLAIEHDYESKEDMDRNGKDKIIIRDFMEIELVDQDKEAINELEDDRMEEKNVNVVKTQGGLTFLGDMPNIEFSGFINETHVFSTEESSMCLKETSDFTPFNVLGIQSEEEKVIGSDEEVIGSEKEEIRSEEEEKVGSEEVIGSEEEEVIRSEEEVIKSEEEVIRSEEEVIRSEEEVIKSEEEVIGSEEEVIGSEEEEVIRSEEEVIRSEKEVIRSEEEVIRSEEEVIKSEEEVIGSEEEVIRSEEEEAIGSEKEEIRSEEEENVGSEEEEVIGSEKERWSKEEERIEFKYITDQKSEEDMADLNSKEVIDDSISEEVFQDLYSEEVIPDLSTENTFDEGKVYESVNHEIGKDNRYNNDLIPDYETLLDDIIDGSSEQSSTWDNYNLVSEADKHITSKDSVLLNENIVKDNVDDFNIREGNELQKEDDININTKNILVVEEPELTVIDTENPPLEATGYSPVAFIEEPVEDRWICVQCGYFNGLEEASCNACDSAAPHINMWRCEKCTFINEKTAHSCHVCKFKNGNIPSPEQSFNFVDEDEPMYMHRPVYREPQLQRSQKSQRRSSSRGRGGRGRGYRGARQRARRDPWICRYCNDSNEDTTDDCRSCGQSMYE